MNPIHRAASLALVLAACSSPAVCGGCGADGGLPDGELPDSFRVDAEIVGVDGLRPEFCTPTLADVDPDGPDWQLAFARVHDPVEPTFKEWSTTRNGDSADGCQRNGGEDCCQPLRTDGDGWTLVCVGYRGGGLQNTFEFHFAADGSGESTTTRRDFQDQVVCVARASWVEILPAQ